jgi:hypothetical protein
MQTAYLAVLVITLLAVAAGAALVSVRLLRGGR